jgi:predicted ATPase
MLNNLVLDNFKSWPTLNMKFKPITLLYGSNSSGKSSIIQFLMLLKQTKDSTDSQVALDFGSEEKIVDLGSFRDAIHQHDATKPLKWTLDWKLDRPLTIYDPGKSPPVALGNGNRLQIAVEVVARGRQVIIDSLSYDFDGSRYYIYRKVGKPKYQLETLNTDFRFVRTLGRAWDLPEPTKGYSFPDQAQTYFQNAQFLSSFESSYVDQMDKIIYLGPLREDPRRQYTWSGSNPSDVGPRGERAVEAILAAGERDEKRNVRWKSRLQSFQEIIAWWLKDLGLINSFEVREVSDGAGLYRVFVKKTAKSSETLITDVGFGVSQILPVLALLYYAPEGSTVLIEQPEIHLHPAVQAGLADLFISVCKTRSIQLVVESHSEHLLNRLLRRIAEKETVYGEITTEDVAVYFADNKSGASVLEPLKLNLYGAIENWPKDFFGDQLGEVVAREQASLKRRLQAA